MKNILEKAKFGDKFRTRGNRMAVLYSRTINKFGFVLISNQILKMENYACIYETDWLGEVYHELDKGTDDLDIIGKWEEPNIEELAEKYAESVAQTNNLPIETQHLLERV